MPPNARLRRTTEKTSEPTRAEPDGAPTERSAVGDHVHRALLEASPLALVVADPRGRIVVANEQALATFGYSREELLGETVEILVPERLRSGHAGHRAAFAAAPGRRPTACGPHLVGRRKDGSEFPVDVALGSLETGKGLLVSAVITDVTARRALEKEHRHLAQVVDQIHDSVVSTDLDGHVTSWNRGAQRLFAYSTEEMIGRHISVVYPEEEHAFLEQGIIAPLKRKGSHEIEVRMRRRSGKTFHAHLSVSMLRDESGADVGMIGYAMDITERKLAEAALRARALQQAAVAELGWHALTGSGLARLEEEAVRLIARTLDVEYCKLLELQPDGCSLLLKAGVGWKEGTVGRAVVPAGVDSQAGYTLHASGAVVVENLADEPRFRGPQLLLDHGVVSGASVIVPLHGRPYGVLGAHTTKRRTFTEDDVNFLQSMANVLAEAIVRKRTEQTLEENRARMQSLSERLVQVQEQERRYLAHELHDEVGQALSAAKIQLHLAARAEDAATAAPFLEECRSILENTLQQVRNLSLDLRPSVLDERGLPAALAWFVERQEQRLGLKVEVVLGPLSGRPDRAVETACFRIVQEAFTNAARHARAETVRVELAQEGDELLLRVTDDGVGFEVDNRLSRAAAGKSFGLLGMQERAALLGGTLAIHSAPGRGTCIEARLPFHPTSEPHGDPEPATA